MSDQPQRSAFLWFVLVACLVYAALFTFSAYVLARDFGRVKDAGWTASVNGNGWIVVTVDEKGAAAGRLAPGDRLLALDGDARAEALGKSFLVNEHAVRRTALISNCAVRGRRSM